MSILEKKLDALIIDPSVLTSDSHVRKLLEAEQRFFVPETLVKAIEEQRTHEILQHLLAKTAG